MTKTFGASELDRNAKAHPAQGGLHLSPLVWIFVPVILLLAAARIQTYVPLSHLTRDPLVVADAPFYIGIFSNLGVLFWCAGGAIALFSGVVCRAHQASQELGRFFLASGVLTLVLMFDDLFQLHEGFLPYHVGIPEDIVYLFYAIAFSWYLIRFRKTLKKTPFGYLGLAFLLLGIAPIFDKEILPMPASWLANDGIFLFEDGFKLLGIVAWFIYFAVSGSQALIGDRSPTDLEMEQP